MEKVEIPITINLPDDWLDKVVERVKQDGDFVFVTRCEKLRVLHRKRKQGLQGALL